MEMAAAVTTADRVPVKKLLVGKQLLILTGFQTEDKSHFKTHLEASLM